MPITPETALVAEPERRFRAFAVDRAIAWTLFAASAVAAWWWFLRDGEVWPGIAIIAGTVVVVSSVFAVILGVKGTSPGRTMMGLRVVSADGGEPIGIPRAVLRSIIVGVGSLPMFGLGLATLAWTAVEDRTRERRGWHDHVARSVVLDVRPRPAAEVEADERPRHVVNLTAMKLMPVRQQPVPVVPAPEPAQSSTPSSTHSSSPSSTPSSVPTGRPVGEPLGEPLRLPGGFETPEARRRRIDTPWPASGSQGRPASQSGPQPDRQSGPQQIGPQQPGPQQPGPQQPGPQQPGPQQAGAYGALQGQQGGRRAAPQTPEQPVTPPPNQYAPPSDGGVIGSGPGRHAGPPAPPGAPRRGAPHQQPAPGQSSPGQPTSGQRRTQPRPPITWRVTFDTGESFVVEGLGIVGRQPSGRPGEPVRHVVPLRSDDMSISKTHAQFHVAADGALVVIDRGSTNGSLLLRKGVSRELVAGRPATLVDGDRVCFGDRQMTVTREG